MSEVFVGGCRAQGGGLHLGHFYGCFYGVYLRVDTSYYFVISDCISGSRVSVAASTVDVCLDVLSLPLVVPAGSVHVVRESGLRSALAPITAAIESVVSYGLLRSAHPHHARLKRGGYGGSISDLIFPVHQAAFLLGLGCTTACYNDDNLDVVRFARECARRANSMYESSALNAELQLILHKPSKLLGFDGRKMAKGHQNFLQLTASRSAVSRFARRFVGRSLGPDGDVHDAPCGDAEIGLANVAGVASVDEYADIRDARERIRILIAGLTLVLGEFQDRRSAIAQTHSSSDALDLMADEESKAASVIDKITDKLMANGT